jgi:uncharacterized membrane protein
MELLQTLIYTFSVRPYVLAFLITFLVLSLMNRGVIRTLLFLVLGYGIAFISEYSSIRNGFPYGMYHYIYEAMEGELIIGGTSGGVRGGVPFWDSLSYTFLAYTSYELSQYLKVRWPHLLAPIFMVAMDIIIDPVASRGDQWFLGKMYYYPEGGAYFGVPYSNFAGWFIVAACIHNAYFTLEKYLPSRPEPTTRQLFLAGPAFYYSIIAFNLVITFWIGEWILGLVGLALHLPILNRFRPK